jgi:hypothetical protein
MAHPIIADNKRDQLPSWDDIQIMVAQLARRPLTEDTEVGTELVIGPGAAKPLRLEISGEGDRRQLVCRVPYRPHHIVGYATKPTSS